VKSTCWLTATVVSGLASIACGGQIASASASPAVQDQRSSSIMLRSPIRAPRAGVAVPSAFTWRP
jgi:hypothetical protein